VRGEEFCEQRLINPKRVINPLRERLLQLIRPGFADIPEKHRRAFGDLPRGGDVRRRGREWLNARRILLNAAERRPRREVGFIPPVRAVSLVSREAERIDLPPRAGWPIREELDPRCPCRERDHRFIPAEGPVPEQLHRIEFIDDRGFSEQMLGGFPALPDPHTEGFLLRAIVRVADPQRVVTRRRDFDFAPDDHPRRRIRTRGDREPFALASLRPGIRDTGSGQRP